MGAVSERLDGQRVPSQRQDGISGAKNPARRETVPTPEREKNRKTPVLRKDLEKAFSKTVEEALSETIWQTVFQRDGFNPEKQQQVRLFNEWGETYPATENSTFLAELHAETTKLITDSTRTLGQTEAQKHLNRMGYLLPELVRALVLTSEDISNIYQRDLLSCVEIAIDWFNNPELIEQTQIRIGMGGEEVVNARTPAYIVSGLKTLERIQEASQGYSVWAINHELFDRAAERIVLKDPEAQKKAREVKRKEIESWTWDRMIEKKPELADKQTKVVMDGDTEKTVQVAPDLHLLPHQEAMQILESAWEQFLGISLDADMVAQLQTDYHFSTQLPKLVIFNAANAAIHINGMDEEKVLSARDQTQQLLRSYVQRYHSTLADSLEFQNDTPWETHDFATRMQLLYARDLVRSFDGKRERAQKILDDFGTHHRKLHATRNGGYTDNIFGMTPSEAYAMLHFFFFADPQVHVDPGQKMPPANIMEPASVSRHVIYHQGTPELVFGVFRKLVAENATIDGFLAWIDNRLLLANQPVDTIAAKVLELAQGGTLKGKTPFALLFQAINIACKESPSARQFLSDMALSDTIKHSDDPLVEWAKVVADLSKNKPAKEDIPQLEALKIQLDQDRTNRVNKRIEINQAHGTRNLELLEQLTNDPLVLRMFYPLTHLETVIRVGAGVPTYYVAEGVDSVVYPTFTPLNFEGYGKAIQAAEAKYARLKKTTQFVNKQLGSGSLPEGATVTLPQEMSRQFATAIRREYDEIEAIEAQGGQGNIEEVKARLAILRRQMKESLRSVLKYDGPLVERSDDIPHLENEEENRAQNFSKWTDAIINDVARTATQAMLEEQNSKIFKLSEVASDIHTLLRDIDPDPQTAAAEYNKFLLETFAAGGTRRGARN